jgi:hypothetical protein
VVVLFNALYFSLSLSLAINNNNNNNNNKTQFSLSQSGVAEKFSPRDLFYSQGARASRTQKSARFFQKGND